jgi:WD40 repeat protein/serine/threonine protein kinase
VSRRKNENRGVIRARNALVEAAAQRRGRREYPAMSERSLFLAALDIEGPAECSAFLDRACHDDPALRAQVEQLLKAHEQPGRFMDRPALTMTTADEPVRERPGAAVGSYKLLEQIGEGGFGVVFLAEQTRPVRRKVALKVLKPGMDTRQVIARFEAERQALALMDHPHIARVLDGGTTEAGLPYFVMELVKGARITDFCDRGRLGVRERLGLFVSVCQAVQHAHQKGIIHRDLKPSNVLVTLHDGRPVPKVIDFGVAKALGQELTDKTLFTGFAQMVGTPAYMSPEQAQMSGLDVDTRSDVYSLGVLLYELLTGTTPLAREQLKAASYDEIRRIIREEEPPRPSTRLSTLGPAAGTVSANRRSEPHRLSALLRGELDWVVLKALEKDRDRRYESASAFAADVERYLRDEPVLACPPSAAYRFRKFARRNRAALLTAALAGGALVAFAVLLADLAFTRRHNVELQKAIGGEARAREAEALARRELENQSYYHRVALASVEWRDNHLGRAEQLLAGCPAPLRRWEWHYLRRVCHADRFTLAEHRAPLTAVAYSPDGKYLASADAQGTVLLRGAVSGRTDHSFTAEAGGVRALAFSPDGRHLAFAAGTQVRLWGVGRRTSALLGRHEQPVVGLAFRHDGKRLASVSADQVITVWDAPDGKGPPSWRAVASWAVPPVKKVAAADLRLPLVFCAGGEYVASLSSNHMVSVWDAATGELKLQVAWPGDTLSLAASPDGKLLAGGGEDGAVRVWDLDRARFGALGQFLRGHGGPVTAVAFSPDGRRLASGGADQMIKVWDPAPTPGGLSGSREELWTLKGQTAEVVGLAYSPDGRHLASADRAGKVRLWAADVDPEVLALKGHQSLKAMAFSADGGQFLTAGAGPTLFVWHLPTGRPLRGVKVAKQPGGVGAFSRDGRLFAAAALREGPPGDAPVKIWDTATGAELQVLRGHTNSLFCAAFSPDGRRLATASYDRTVRVWDVDTGRQLYLLPAPREAVYALAFSPDGTRLASGGAGAVPAVRLWDLTTGRELRVLSGHPGQVWGLSFDPDGRRLASAGGDGAVKLWDVATGRLLFTLAAHLNFGARGVAFSPDGHRLVTVGRDHTIKVWDAANGENPLSLHGGAAVRGPEAFLGVTFSPDGWRFATATPDTVKVWDATPLAAGPGVGR